MTLTQAMRAEAAKLTDRAKDYIKAGEYDLGVNMRRTAFGLMAAVNMLEIAYAGEREAKEGIEA